ncbi:hypothetical protein [Burkholderia metallica]|nr:hypothetical protein [Burkholderia metallica]
MRRVSSPISHYLSIEVIGDATTVARLIADGLPEATLPATTLER